MELVRPVEQQRRCALYRHYDDQDVLLYVGITDNLGERTNGGHARSSDWVRFAARAEAEWHDSRELASSAERKAVREERPVFNRQYAEWDVDREIGDYLQRREIERMRSTLDEYDTVVRRFLRLAPQDDVKLAERKALLDYRYQDLAPDERFPVNVLRHLANAIEDGATPFRDDARGDAFIDVLEFLRGQLEVIRDRHKQVEEPPF